MAETATKVTTQSHEAEKAQEKRERSEPVSEKEQMAELVSFEGLLGDSVRELPIERHAVLLSDPRLSHPANAAQKARIVAGLQHSYGNIYVQRLLKRVTEPSEMEAEAVGQTAFHDLDIGVKSRAEMTGAIARDKPKAPEALAPAAEGTEAQRKLAELAGRWRSAWFGLVEARAAARRGDYESAFAKCVNARVIATAFKGIPGFSEDARGLINLTEFGAEHAVGGLDALRTGGKSVFTALDGAVLAAGSLQNSLLTGAEPRTVPAPGGP